MTAELWWVVAAPDGRLLAWTFDRKPDMAKFRAEDGRLGKWPAMEADGYSVVQVEVRRV